MDKMPPITELSDPQNIVQLKVDGKNTYAHRNLNEKFIVPKGTLFKINEILLQNSVCYVGYIPEKRLWYVLLGKKVLWNNFNTTQKQPKKKPKPQFNRYIALLKNKRK